MSLYQLYCRERPSTGNKTHVNCNITLFFKRELCLSSSYLTVKLCFKNRCRISIIMNHELTVNWTAVQQLKIVLCVAKQRTPVGFDPVHLQLCMLILCFLIHCLTDCTIMADEIIKKMGQFIQANTEPSMSTKFLD